jgi:hypothetical protein
MGVVVASMSTADGAILAMVRVLWLRGLYLG